MPSLIAAAHLQGDDFLIITIGTTSDDKRVLHKSFSGSNINVQLKQPCDILNPVFILDYNANLVSANYLRCPELSRYYFINNINLMPGHRMELTCSVDVLMTYANQIDRINCVVTRQQNSGLTLVPDTGIMVQNYNPIYIYNFPNSFDVSFGSYILQVIGGK